MTLPFTVWCVFGKSFQYFNSLVPYAKCTVFVQCARNVSCVAPKTSNLVWKSARSVDVSHRNISCSLPYCESTAIIVALAASDARMTGRIDQLKASVASPTTPSSLRRRIKLPKTTVMFGRASYAARQSSIGCGSKARRTDRATAAARSTACRISEMPSRATSSAFYRLYRRLPLIVQNVGRRCSCDAHWHIWA